jgi:hypothetical protein
MEETGLLDADGAMIKEGDICSYKGMENCKVVFIHYSWALMQGKKLITYFKDIRKLPTIYKRGVE